ncbi:gamma-glutamyl kinase [Ruegeria marisrubri]|uniref:Gamma-glutamyl kinase n=1 Tax=Ruegeria marisrubri TaxID=1685379 RepID=A0A117KHE2_9RHOB|nr:sulfotransferase family 2 domain-containing protein [Ruegeria marisrubri]KUJ86144.1 gamma-glutamyl kinase [Ruegeria marisrubri]
MLVFLKERLVFLSVPKTGTTAFHTALRSRADIVVSNPPELKHSTIYRYDRFFRPIFTKLFDTDPEVMAVVREPIDWLGSWYRYRARPALRGQPVSTQGISFDDFVRAYLRGVRPEYAKVGSQSKFLTPRRNGVEVEHLFKYEHQDKILEFLQNRLGDALELQRENVSPVMPATLSREVEDLYRRKCADEFRLHASAT